MFRGSQFILRMGGGWHFLEINILTSKMVKKLSSSGKKINNLTGADPGSFVRGSNFPKSFDKQKKKIIIIIKERRKKRKKSRGEKTDGLGCSFSLQRKFRKTNV